MIEIRIIAKQPGAPPSGLTSTLPIRISAAYPTVEHSTQRSAWSDQRSGARLRCPPPIILVMLSSARETARAAHPPSSGQDVGRCRRSSCSSPGAPGSGKRRRWPPARPRGLAFPMLSKDTIKEALGRHRPGRLGREQRAARRSLRGRPVRADQRPARPGGLRRRRPHVPPGLRRAVLPLVERSTTVLVHCRVPQDVLTERVAERQTSRARPRAS